MPDIPTPAGAGPEGGAAGSDPGRTNQSVEDEERVDAPNQKL